MAWAEQLLMCQRKGWYHLPSREAILGPKLVNNSCPVSDIPFLRKKVFGPQLQGTLDEVDYLNPFQSGFRLEWYSDGHDYAYT